jgi:hypothetical protein
VEEWWYSSTILDLVNIYIYIYIYIERERERERESERWMISLTYRPFRPLHPLRKRLGGLQGRSGRYGVEKNMLYPEGIESKQSSLKFVVTPTKLFRVPKINTFVILHTTELNTPCIVLFESAGMHLTK